MSNPPAEGQLPAAHSLNLCTAGGWQQGLASDTDNYKCSIIYWFEYVLLFNYVVLLAVVTCWFKYFEVIIIAVGV